MKIEKLTRGPFTMPGHTILDVIPAHHSPLDLLVREGIQNSLDASREIKDHKFAKVEFLTGKFVSEDFANLLDGISERIHEQLFMPRSTYEYIAVKDYNTCGLDGPISIQHAHKQNQHAGTLINLIYSIGYNQAAAGAGGSWGFGKTTYFKMGIGLVCFYSRVFENGEYSSRLAVVLVEDSRKKHTLLPKDKNCLGVAFWGDTNKYDSNATQPLTDAAEIESVLHVFKISPYRDTETGTTVIMPYVKLAPLVFLSYQSYASDRVPYFASTVDNYLPIAVARWYAPRLNNSDYPYGKYLRAWVNREEVDLKRLPPVYSILQKLYKFSFNPDEMCKLDNYKIEIKPVHLNGKQISKNDKVGGKLVFLKLSKEQLGMLEPDNYLSPYTYFARQLDDENSPIICYVRKPGMVVGFDVNGDWSRNCQIEPDTNHFIIGMFVLDSDKTLSSDISLEEYIRASEIADHASWKKNPCRAEVKDLNIVPRIQSEVRKILNETFGKQDPIINPIATGLAHEFAWLLPSDSFGREPSPKPKKGSVPDPKKTKGSALVHILEHKSDTIVVEFKVFQPNFRIELMISSEDGDRSAEAWEKQMDTPFPFSFLPAEINSGLEIAAYTPGITGKTILCTLDKYSDENRCEVLTVKKLKTARNVFYGMDIWYCEKFDSGEIFGTFELPKGVDGFTCSVSIEAMEKLG